MYRAGYPRVTHPSAALLRRESLDLHVLGTPPAFILSQDQTLMFKFVRSKSVWLILPFYCCFRFLFSEISLRTFCSVWNFQVALLFICQGAVLLIGSVSRRTFVPVVQTAYLVYHKQFCLSRTFFILFSSFFRNLVAYHSQQQFIILSELSVCVKQFFIFLNFFLEIRVAFVRRNNHKVYQDCLSMSSSFVFF